MALNGKVKNWNTQKKFGFIVPQAGGEDLFFHISELPKGKKVHRGEDVTYDLGKDHKGRECAVNINNSQSERKTDKSSAPAAKPTENAVTKEGKNNTPLILTLASVILILLALLFSGVVDFNSKSAPVDQIESK